MTCTDIQSLVDAIHHFDVTVGIVGLSIFVILSAILWFKND